MTLLSIAQAAADEIGILRPSGVISNSDPDAQKLLRCANKVGTRLMKAVDWQDLRKEQTFTSVATEAQTSILPSDFDRFVAETFWDRTAQDKISGPISAVEWQGFKAMSYADTNNRKFIYRRDGVSILPTMPAGNTLAFEYISNQWCTDSGGTGQSAWAADTDLGVLDEELMTLALIVDYLGNEGLPMDKAMMDFTDYYDRLVDNDQPDGNIVVAADIFGLGSRHFTGVPAYNSTGIDTI